MFPWLGEEAWHESIEVTDAQKAFVIKRGEEARRLRRSAARRVLARRRTSLEEEVRRAAAVGMRRLRELEDENGRLKKIVANLTLDREILQDVIKRKL